MAKNKPKRKLSNYLLDKKLQLRYVIFVTALSAVICGTLGYLIWQQADVATDTIREQLSETPEMAEEVISSLQSKDQNLIVVNSGHRDFVYATRQKTLKLRYVCRLFSKELVLHNFPGYSPEQLLERMIELSLYTEENLR